MLDAKGLAVGQRFDFGSNTISEEEIVGLAKQRERSTGCFGETNAPYQTGADLEDHPNHPPGRDHILEAGAHGLVEYEGID
jgi:hypothetical protein